MAKQLRRALPTSFVGRLARWPDRAEQPERARDQGTKRGCIGDSPAWVLHKRLQRRRPALEAGLAEALGPRGAVRPRQLELFEATAAPDVDGRPVDLGGPVTLHPEGKPGTIVEMRACYPAGGRPWHQVVVELDEGGPRNVRGSHQVRARA